MLSARLTTDPGEDLHPVWSPDGKTIAFASEIDESAAELGPGLAWITESGERPERLLRTPEPGHLEFPTSWSPDGRWLAYMAERSGTGGDIFLFPTSGPREPRPLLQTPSHERAAMFSPDGRWIAYVSDRSGREEGYVMPFPGPGESSRVSNNGGAEPVWVRRGDELLYRDGDKLMSVTAPGGAWGAPGAPALLFEGKFEPSKWGAGAPNYDLTPDGRHFVMVRAWILKLSGPH